MKIIGYLAIAGLITCIVYLGVNKDTPAYKSASELMHVGR